MASTLKVGAKVASSSKLKKFGVAAGLIAAAGYGAARQDPIQYTMNATQEAVFGTDQIDNMVLGTDLSARNFVGLPFGMEFTPGSSAAGGAVFGGGIGAVLGRGKIGALAGGAIGAGIGAIAGAASGALNSNAGRVLFPRENVANMFSRKSLNTTAFEFRRADRMQAEGILENAAEYSTTRGYSEYENSIFPQRMTTRRWNSATGDIVLGSYNLRRG